MKAPVGIVQEAAHEFHEWSSMASISFCRLIFQDGVTGPLRAERDELKERLDEVSSSLRDATARMDNVIDERDQLQFQLSRLDEKLIKKESYVPSQAGNEIL